MNPIVGRPLLILKLFNMLIIEAKVGVEALVPATEITFPSWKT
jgi:hypothetical protein